MGIETDPTRWLLLDWAMVLVGAWLLIGLAGVWALRRFELVSQVLFPLGGAVGVVLSGGNVDPESLARYIMTDRP